MIVFDNIIYSLQKAGGISLYWSELLKRASISGLECLQYGNGKGNIFQDKKNAPLRESVLSPKILRYLSFQKKLSEGDVFHSSYYRISPAKGVLNVTTVHDFTYEYYFRGLKKNIHSFQKYNAIKKADAIICISENTKKDLLSFFPFAERKKVFVVYNGVSDKFFQINSNGNNKMSVSPYILFVGDRRGYKNFELVVESMKVLESYSLYIVGGALNEKEINILQPIRDRVRFKGYVSSEELNILYNEAFCLAYPSEYEGFGIPLIESMVSGCPYIAKKGSSITEVASAADTLMIETTVDNFVGIVRKLEVDSFRNEAIELGLLKASMFSWDQCYTKTTSIYSDLLR